MHTQCVQSAYVRVVYKSDRDIVEANDASYAESAAQLDAARQAFRRLNRALRADDFTVIVDLTHE